MVLQHSLVTTLEYFLGVKTANFNIRTSHRMIIYALKLYLCTVTFINIGM